MARIEGVDLPRNKRVDIALTYIFGIGRPTAGDICDEANVGRDIKAGDLSETEGRSNPERDPERLPVEGDLRKEIAMNIKRLIDIGAYRGLRHKRVFLFVVSVHTNARTRKGPVHRRTQALRAE